MGIFEDLKERQVSVQSGYPAVLDLPPIESIERPSVTWQSEDGEQLYGIKYVITTKNQLIILSAEVDDQKGYRARAINTQLGKEENSAYIRINVTGDRDVEIAPEIIVFPESVNLIKGEQLAELQCIANARPLHQLETLWMKDGILIENSGVEYTLNDPWNRTLVLLSVNLTHTGQYTCHVKLRSGGFPTATATASVIVMEPPSFFSPMRAETLGDYGTKLLLPCDVLGEPPPNITWFRNAVPLDLAGDRYTVRDDNSLLIRKLSMDDSAMFQCLARNGAGDKSSYTWLKVKSKFFLNVFFLN